MRLESYSIDDLHQLALAEAEAQNDENAVQLLNDIYKSLLREYIVAIQLVRERSAETSTPAGW